jgi:sec-independent protein translocase protein TatA
MTAFVLAGAIGFQEILIVALFLLVLFGGKKIPELMRGIGQGMKEFKKSMKDDSPDTTAQKKSEEN